MTEENTGSYHDIDEAACALIGKFITEFARAEAYVCLLACRRSGMGDRQGRFVFGGMRLGDTAVSLRGIIRLEQNEPGEFDDIDSCLTQLDLIGKQRHKIAHRFVQIGEHGISASNLYTSKNFDSHETDTYSFAELTDMVADCQRIRSRIYRHTDGEARRREQYDLTWLPSLFAPWQYRRATASNKNPK